MKAFENEAEARWGGSAEYKEYEEKAMGRSAEEQNALAAGLDMLMDGFALCMKNDKAPGSSEAQALVIKLQSYITEHYYACTDDILASLGEMYVGDERFKRNIDRHGEGTADFIRRAIQLMTGR